MRKYVRLEEGHCLSCITEATGIVVFPPDSHATDVLAWIEGSRAR